MAYVSEVITWATHEADLKEYLEIELADTSEDFWLELWLASATELADQYLENPFKDSEGADIPLPKAVEVGVYELVKQWRLHLDKDQALTEAKTAQLTEKYGKISAELPEYRGIAVRFWRPWKLKIWLE